MRASSVFRHAALIGLGLASISSPALALLGGARDSVETDRAHLSARRASLAAATHTVEALTLPNGSVVQEYVRPDGKVFAVTWHGPSRPDLRQLLGGYFSALQSDNVPAAGAARRTRRPLTVQRADFTVHTGGHSGAFWGVAFLPGEAPAGFSVGDLRR